MKPGAYGCLGGWIASTCLLIGVVWGIRAADATNPAAAFPSLKQVQQKWDPQSLETVTRAAESGDLTAQHYLGFCYASGDRVLQNGKTAVEWYERAAQAGYLPSYGNLGMLYQYGRVVPRDLAKTLRNYQLAADAGLPQGQANLAMLYRDGVGVGRNPAEALKWFRLAAAQGHAVSMMEIGRAYRFGQGVRQNSREAIKWFEKAVEQGEPLAELNLGLIFEDEGNLDMAAKYYRQAAEHGLADAMWMVHLFYEAGRGVTKDDGEAMRWLRMGAEAGSARAQVALGYHNQNPGRESGNRVGDQPASMAEAVKWYRRAAEQDWPDGQYRLAGCYLQGKGVELDEERGLELMRAAADADHCKAMVELTELYARGIGEPCNRQDEPLQWLQRAEKHKEQGTYGIYKRPYDLLVFRYEHGIGTDQDLVTAASWYIRGALTGAFRYSLDDKLDYVPSRRHALYTTWGHPERSTLQLTEQGDSAASAALSEVLATYLKAAQPNAGTNALKIAELFVAGRNVPRSQVKAWAWFSCAAQRGAPEGADRSRAIETKLTPPELAEARKELRQITEFLNSVGPAIRRRSGTPQGEQMR
jgi:uncharacterized protein